MHQIAAERRASERASTPSERIALALRLGDDAVEMFRAAPQLVEAPARDAPKISNRRLA